MDRQELIAHAKRLRDKVAQVQQSAGRDRNGKPIVDGLQAQVTEFLRSAVGKDSAFYEQANGLGGVVEWRQPLLLDVIDSFIDYAEAGLVADVSPERQAQLDVVSDFLDQAGALLDDKKVHPATAAVLIGASLEEFLRTWVEDATIPMKGRKTGLHNYAQSLRDEDKITKQDMKDITAWSGIRNSAAHGHWDEVADRQRIRIMLESVNLFMRRYGS